MKKSIFLFAGLFSIAISSISFIAPSSSLKLYPELEDYFNGVKTKQFSKDRMEALINIQYSISMSDMDSEDWNLIFYCSENSFRSQASQVFAQTLCSTNKHKRIKVYSAGFTAGDVNPKLISYLTKIGYRISKKDKDGNTFYEVKFSDQANPIILFSKTTVDKSLPTKDITSIVVCDINKEADCKNLKTATTSFNLPFDKVNSTDNDADVEKTLKSIASEMVFVTTK